MDEYFTEAVVLRAEPNGDLDSRFSIFTRKFGKLLTRAKSARKITSKLAGHLQPGNVVRVRLVEKNGLWVVDALKSQRLALSLGELYMLERLLGEAEPDARIWEMLFGEISWGEALKLLGWDPKEAACAECGRSRPRAFYLRSQEFFCDPCASKLNADDVLYIRS